MVEASLLGEAERDQALPEHVLHRLAEAEVDAEGERGEELGEGAAGGKRLRWHRGQVIADGGLSKSAFRGLSTVYVQGATV